MSVNSICSWLMGLQKKERNLQCFLMKMLKSVGLLCCPLIINPVFLEAAHYFCFIGSQVVFKQNPINSNFTFWFSPGPYCLMTFKSKKWNIDYESENLIDYSCVVRDLAFLSSLLVCKSSILFLLWQDNITRMIKVF